MTNFSLRLMRNDFYIHGPLLRLKKIQYVFFWIWVRVFNFTIECRVLLGTISRFFPISYEKYSIFVAEN